MRAFLAVVLFLCGWCVAQQYPYEKTNVFTPLCARGAFSTGSLSKWCTSYELCTWQGITCSGTENRVSAIVLTNLQINGTIPPEFGQLANLATLDMSGNKLSGSLPPQLTQNTNLETLDVHSNAIQGEIPSLSSATLTHLDLSGNKLVGSIPANLGSTSLRVLDLHDNMLSSTIPPLVASLPLQLIDLSGNAVEGTIPTELGAVDAVQGMERDLGVINLANCNLTGTIPTQIGNLQSLVLLQLAQNNLNGEIPTTLGDLKFLTQLSLENNQLGGTIPEALGSSERLQFLTLTGNQFVGSIPEKIGELSDLAHLFIGGETMQGRLPTSLFARATLQTLFIVGTKLSGTIPSTVGQLTNLGFLSLATNVIGGTLASEMSQLSSSLRQLEIQNNFLTGTLPTGLESVASVDCANQFLDSEICGQKAAMTFTAPQRIISFMDTNAITGIIQGKVYLESAADETGLGVYAVYLGNNNQKLSAVLGTSPVQAGSAVSVEIGPVSIGSATQLLAYSATAPGFNEVGPVSYAITDVVDVNECATNNGGCEQICTNTEGSFQCSCGAGQEIGADGVTCVAASPSPSPSGVPPEFICGSEASVVVYPVQIDGDGAVSAACTCSNGSASFTFPAAPSAGTRLWAKSKCIASTGDNWLVGQYTWQLSSSNDYVWNQYLSPLPKSNTITLTSQEANCHLLYLYLGKLTPQDWWYKACPLPSPSPSPSQDPQRNIMCPSQGTLNAPMTILNGELVADCSGGSSCSQASATFPVSSPGNLWVLAACNTASPSGSWYVDGHAWTLQYSALGATWQQFGYVSSSFELTSDQPDCRIQLVFVGPQTPVLGTYSKNCQTPSATISVSPSVSLTKSLTKSPSLTPSSTVTPSITRTISLTHSLSPSTSFVPSPSKPPSPSVTASPSSSKAPTPSPAASQQADSKGGSSNATVAVAAAVAAVGGLLAVIALVSCFCSRSKSLKRASVLPYAKTQRKTVEPPETEMVQVDARPVEELPLPTTSMMCVYPTWQRLNFDKSSLTAQRIVVIIFAGGPNPVFVWVGSGAMQIDKTNGEKLAESLLQKLEIRSGQIFTVQEGNEPSEFWEWLENV